MSQQYRKKPVVIEAKQWTGENIHDLWGWAGAGSVYGPVPAENGRPAAPARLYVAANDAWLDLEVGEWIIRDARGLYPCKPEIFEATYELVDEDAVDVAEARAALAEGGPLISSEDLRAELGVDL